MTIWDEAFEALADPDAGLTESVIYYANSAAEPRSFEDAPFDELISPEINDDVEGRSEQRRALLQLPLTNDDGAVSIATDAKAWFVIRSTRWTIDRVLEDHGSWHVYLTAPLDQTIRRGQRSTRNPRS